MTGIAWSSRGFDRPAISAGPRRSMGTRVSCLGFCGFSWEFLESQRRIRLGRLLARHFYGLRQGFTGSWVGSRESRQEIPVPFFLALSSADHVLTNEDARRPVSRVLSVRRTERDDHSSGTRLAARLSRPTRTTGRECPRIWRTKMLSSLFGLAPGGVCPAAPVTRGAVRFYRTVSPLPAG